jgi:hypothetical protein
VAESTSETGAATLTVHNFVRTCQSRVATLTTVDAVTPASVKRALWHFAFEVIAFLQLKRPLVEVVCGLHDPLELGVLP